MRNPGPWYFDRNDDKFGPISTEILRQMLLEGKISPQQIVWQVVDGRHDYVRAEQAALEPA